DQGHSLFSISLKRELHSLDHAHARQTLQERGTLLACGIDVRYGLSECRFTFGLICQQLLELLTLFRRNRRRSRQSGDERAIGAKPIQILHQFLSYGSRQGPRRGGQKLDRTARAFYQSRGDLRLINEIPSAIAK